MDRHLVRLKREIAETLSRVSAQELSWHPPGQWCVAEQLEHLYLTYTGTWKGFQRVAEAGRPIVSPASWKQFFARQLVLRFDYLPSGRQAPSSARPRGLPNEKVRAEIVSKIDEMETMISRCEQTLGSGQLLDHPILGPLTGAQWRKFHLVHGLHHLRQIEKLRQGIGRQK